MFREVILSTFRKIVLLPLLLFFVSVGLVRASEAEKEFVLVYTGDVRGYVEGCG